MLVFLQKDAEKAQRIPRVFEYKVGPQPTVLHHELIPLFVDAEARAVKMLEPGTRERERKSVSLHAMTKTEEREHHGEHLARKLFDGISQSFFKLQSVGHPAEKELDKIC